MLININDFFTKLTTVVYNDNGLTIFGFAFLLFIVLLFFYLIYHFILLIINIFRKEG